MSKKIKLAIVGIRGLPNNYGGFETLADYLVQYLADEIDITVYCSSKDMDSRLSEYKGSKLKYIPVTSHGSLGILYDSLSLIQALIKYDKILFLGFGGGFVMPFLKMFRHKMILNIGGLDWKRNKWSPFAQKVIKKAEQLLIANSSCIVSDNVGIQNYIKETYNRESTLIAYGGDQAKQQPINTNWTLKYPFLKGEYAFTVCRIQPDNNIDLMLEAFVEGEIPFVLLGNWNNSEYGIQTKAKYAGTKNLILLDAIYEREELDVLRSNCSLYVHGHSAGGTNPSLVEAMHLALPVFAFASGYNENTTANLALYFKDAADLSLLLKDYKQIDLKKMGQALQAFAQKHYLWHDIADQYKKLILN